MWFHIARRLLAFNPACKHYVVGCASLSGHHYLVREAVPAVEGGAKENDYGTAGAVPAMYHGRIS